MARYCTNCGTEFKEGAMFCTRCGSRRVGAGTAGAGAVKAERTEPVTMRSAEKTKKARREVQRNEEERTMTNNTITTNTAVKQRYDIKQIAKTVILALIGGFLGRFLFSDTGFPQAACFLFGCGIPFGWMFLRKHQKFSVIPGGVVSLCIILIVKLLASFFIGWVVMPIEVVKMVKGIVQTTKYNREVKEVAQQYGA